MIKESRVHYENPLMWLKAFRQPRTVHMTEWRYQKEIKLYYIINGRLDVWIGSEQHTLKDGDLFLIGPSEIHRDFCERLDELDHIVLYVYPAHFFDSSTLHYAPYFSSSIQPLSSVNYIFRENAAAREQAVHIVSEVFREKQHQQIGYELLLSSLVKQLFMIILRCDWKEKLVCYNPSEMVRLKPVFDYVEKHLHTQMTVEELAKQMNMSYHYFVKMFKKVVGIPFIEFVNRKKIERAKDLILTTDRSMSEIGYEVGFPNKTHFYDLFKRYNGCAPRQFRTERENWRKQPS